MTSATHTQRFGNILTDVAHCKDAFDIVLFVSKRPAAINLTRIDGGSSVSKVLSETYLLVFGLFFIIFGHNSCLFCRAYRFSSVTRKLVFLVLQCILCWLLLVFACRSIIWQVVYGQSAHFSTDRTRRCRVVYKSINWVYRHYGNYLLIFVRFWWWCEFGVGKYRNGPNGANDR